MSWVETLNALAIEDGLLLPDGQSERRDFSLKLGEKLTRLETKCYDIIQNLTAIGGFVSTKMIYENLYPNTRCNPSDASCVWTLVGRVKQKLGEEAIVTRPGLGYASRRAFNQIPRRSEDLSAPGRN